VEKKEDEMVLRQGFIPVTAIFGNLECDWLADAHEWGVCQVLLNRQGAAKQNLHRFTSLYQFLTRFSFRLDDTIAE